MFQSPPWEEVATSISLDRYTFAPRSTRPHFDDDQVGTHCIVRTPGVVGGKPRIAGRRISVQQIVVWHEQSAMSREQIASEFDLSLEEIDTALSYYRKHREDIDAAIRADDADVTMMERQAQSILR